MPDQPPKPHRPDGTLNALVAALGVSKRRVSALLKEGMPDTVEGALAWRKQEDCSDSAEQLRRERILLVREQKTKAAIENQKARKELLPLTEVNARDVAIGAAMNAALRALENELPALCLGLRLERSRPIVKDKVRAIQAMLADKLSEFWTENQPT